MKCNHDWRYQFWVIVRCEYIYDADDKGLSKEKKREIELYEGGGDIVCISCNKHFKFFNIVPKDLYNTISKSFIEMAKRTWNIEVGIL